MNKHLSFMGVSNPNTLYLCFSSSKCFLNLDLIHPHSLNCLKRTQNEEDMIVRSKWCQCLVNALIYTLKFNKN